MPFNTAQSSPNSLAPALSNGFREFRSAVHQREVSPPQRIAFAPTEKGRVESCRPGVAGRWMERLPVLLQLIGATRRRIERTSVVPDQCSPGWTGLPRTSGESSPTSVPKASPKPRPAKRSWLSHTIDGVRSETNDRVADSQEEIPVSQIEASISSYYPGTPRRLSFDMRLNIRAPKILERADYMRWSCKALPSSSYVFRHICRRVAVDWCYSRSDISTVTPFNFRSLPQPH